MIKSKKETLIREELSEDGVGAGVEAEDIDSDISHPFDPKEIDINTKQLTIGQILARINHDEIILNPDFQRKGGIWKIGAKSRLIESILLRIPLPVFYLHMDKDDNWIVVDGLQRITTLNEYISKESWALRELEYLSDFEGRYYSELPRPMQRRIDETSLVIHLIQPGTPKEVTRTIFRRINTGGLPLSAQEIRHALYQGVCTFLLNELANSVEYIDATDNSISDDRMGRREVILRFLAFWVSSPESYTKKDMDGFLCNAMELINNYNKSETERLVSDFSTAMVRSKKILGRYAFRKTYEKDGKRYPINKALFETWSYSLAKVDEKEFNQLLKRKLEVREIFIDLMNGALELENMDEKLRDRFASFEETISQDTSDPNKVQYRFQAVKYLLKHVLEG